MTTTLTVDDLRLEVRRSARRKTMALTVGRDGELTLNVPVECSTALMRRFVQDKRFWLYTKIAEKDALRHPVTKKEFVSGEGFPYLGRNHRLLLVDRQDVPLKLERGRFHLLRSEAKQGRSHFICWYTRRARSWLGKAVEQRAPQVGVALNPVEVRDLGFRWGSCGAKGTLNFHWATILLPPTMIEYVVVHELVHLNEPRHTAEFWLRVERAMPDYERRKRWLAEHGMVFASI